MLELPPKKRETPPRPFKNFGSDVPHPVGVKAAQRQLPPKLADKAALEDFTGIVGGIAQLVERLVRNEKVWGSNPHTSTIQKMPHSKKPFPRKSVVDESDFLVYSRLTLIGLS